MSDDSRPTHPKTDRPEARPFLASEESDNGNPILPASSLQAEVGKPEGTEELTSKEAKQEEVSVPTAEDTKAPEIAPIYAEKEPGVKSESASVAPPMPHYNRQVADQRPVASSESMLSSAYRSGSTKKTSVLLGSSVIAAMVIGVVVYGLNQDIYSLAPQTEESSRVATTEQTNQSPSTLAAISGKKVIRLSFKNLQNLEEGHYQLWLEQGETVSSLGLFSLNDKGEPIDGEGKPLMPEATFEGGQARLLVTIESGKEAKDAPSKSAILSGLLTKDQTTITFDVIDFSSVSGSYVLATPTDLDRIEQASGVWMAKTDGKELTGPGLRLPKAPEGWVYEGQIIYKDQVVAMGRFSSVDGKDDFSRFTPNPDRSPGFPGEDYLQGAPSRLGTSFPANLADGDWKVLVSLEPDSNGTDPSGDGTFYIHLLEAAIAKDSKTLTEYELKVSSTPLPQVRVSLE